MVLVNSKKVSAYFRPNEYAAIRGVRSAQGYESDPEAIRHLVRWAIRAAEAFASGLPIPEPPFNTESK